MAAEQPIPRIIQVLDFMVAIHAAVCSNDRLSVLLGTRQELACMDYHEVVALRDGAFALQALCETRLMEFPISNGEGDGRAANIEP